MNHTTDIPKCDDNTVNLFLSDISKTLQLQQKCIIFQVHDKLKTFHNNIPIKHWDLVQNILIKHNLTIWKTNST